MTTASRSLRRYDGALASGFATAQLHHYSGRDPQLSNFRDFSNFNEPYYFDSRQTTAVLRALRDLRKTTKCKADHVVNKGLCISCTGDQCREHLFDQVSATRSRKQGAAILKQARATAGCSRGRPSVSETSPKMSDFLGSAARCESRAWARGSRA